MFESGMEELTLLFVQRKGFGDSLEEKHELRSTDRKRVAAGNFNEEKCSDPHRRASHSSTLVVSELEALQLYNIFQSNHFSNSFTCYTFT